METSSGKKRRILAIITPSGIIYMMTVTLTHAYIDKYVPEPVAKKAGGAAKAYY